jgi:hypothetical protein
MRLGLVLLASVLLVMPTLPPAARSSDPAAALDACPPALVGASLASANQSGCCHFGGGICGCKGGRAQCCKGNLTSSCPCGPQAAPAQPPDLRGPGRDGPPLRLKRAAFTDKTSGPPLLRKTSTKAGEPVWLWLELDCPDACVNQLATSEDPALKVTVYWYFDPGSGPILRDDLKLDQAVPPEPPPPRVAIPVALPAGNWVAEVGYGADRVCLADDTTCAFRIRVTK